ncbi:unnamed protein product [Amoebophrya sp. A120]|nr:unnamed protein product [Amoebophrya sp. A120]|eukprot:GSA120T00021623001.1
MNVLQGLAELSKQSADVVSQQNELERLSQENERLYDKYIREKEQRILLEMDQVYQSLQKSVQHLPSGPPRPPPLGGTSGATSTNSSTFRHQALGSGFGSSARGHSSSPILSRGAEPELQFAEIGNERQLSSEYFVQLALETGNLEELRRQQEEHARTGRQKVVADGQHDEQEGPPVCDSRYRNDVEVKASGADLPQQRTTATSDLHHTATSCRESSSSTSYCSQMLPSPILRNSRSACEETERAGALWDNEGDPQMLLHRDPVPDSDKHRKSVRFVQIEKSIQGALSELVPVEVTAEETNEEESVRPITATITGGTTDATRIAREGTGSSAPALPSTQPPVVPKLPIPQQRELHGLLTISSSSAQSPALDEVASPLTTLHLASSSSSSAKREHRHRAQPGGKVIARKSKAGQSRGPLGVSVAPLVEIPPDPAAVEPPTRRGGGVTDIEDTEMRQLYTSDGCPVVSSQGRGAESAGAGLVASSPSLVVHGGDTGKNTNADRDDLHNTPKPILVEVCSASLCAAKSNRLCDSYGSRDGLVEVALPLPPDVERSPEPANCDRSVLVPEVADQGPDVSVTQVGKCAKNVAAPPQIDYDLFGDLSRTALTPTASELRRSEPGEPVLATDGASASPQKFTRARNSFSASFLRPQDRSLLQLRSASSSSAEVSCSTEAGTMTAGGAFPTQQRAKTTEARLLRSSGDSLHEKLTSGAGAHAVCAETREGCADFEDRKSTGGTSKNSRGTNYLRDEKARHEEQESEVEQKHNTARDIKEALVENSLLLQRNHGRTSSAQSGSSRFALDPAASDLANLPDVSSFWLDSIDAGSSIHHSPSEHCASPSAAIEGPRGAPQRKDAALVPCVDNVTIARSIAPICPDEQDLAQIRDEEPEKLQGRSQRGGSCGVEDGAGESAASQSRGPGNKLAADENHGTVGEGVGEHKNAESVVHDVEEFLDDDFEESGLVDVFLNHLQQEAQQRKAGRYALVDTSSLHENFQDSSLLSDGNGEHGLKLHMEMMPSSSSATLSTAGNDKGIEVDDIDRALQSFGRFNGASGGRARNDYSGTLVDETSEPRGGGSATFAGENNNAKIMGAGPSLVHQSPASGSGSSQQRPNKAEEHGDDGPQPESLGCVVCSDVWTSTSSNSTSNEEEWKTARPVLEEDEESRSGARAAVLVGEDKNDHDGGPRSLLGSSAGSQGGTGTRLDLKKTQAALSAATGLEDDLKRDLMQFLAELGDSAGAASGADSKASSSSIGGAGCSAAPTLRTRSISRSATDAAASERAGGREGDDEQHSSNLLGNSCTSTGSGKTKLLCENRPPKRSILHSVEDMVRQMESSTCSDRWTARGRSLQAGTQNMMLQACSDFSLVQMEASEMSAESRAGFAVFSSRSRPEDQNRRYEHEEEHHSDVEMAENDEEVGNIVVRTPACSDQNAQKNHASKETHLLHLEDAGTVRGTGKTERLHPIGIKIANEVEELALRHDKPVVAEYVQTQGAASMLIEGDHPHVEHDLILAPMTLDDESSALKMELCGPPGRSSDAGFLASAEAPNKHLFTPGGPSMCSSDFPKEVLAPAEQETVSLLCEEESVALGQHGAQEEDPACDRREHVRQHEELRNSKSVIEKSPVLHFGHQGQQQNYKSPEIEDTTPLAHKQPFGNQARGRPPAATNNAWMLPRESLVEVPFSEILLASTRLQDRDVSGTSTLLYPNESQQSDSRDVVLGAEMYSVVEDEEEQRGTPEDSASGQEQPDIAGVVSAERYARVARKPAGFRDHRYTYENRPGPHCSASWEDLSSIQGSWTTLQQARLKKPRNNPCASLEFSRSILQRLDNLADMK